MAVKKRTEPNWQDLRTFLALGRHGSLSAAARVLGVNHATIARRIQSLEATLGDKLVERRPDGYVLTAAGTRTLGVASDMEAAARNVARGVADETPRSLVRINAPPALAQGFLLRHVATLPGRCPGLDIELATDLRVVSLERHQTDVAVRMVRPRDSDLIATRLAAVAYGYYGTRAGCRRVERGDAPVLIGFDEANAHLPEAIWQAQQHPRMRVAFRASHHVAQADAARAGAGLALLPHYIGRSTPGLQLSGLQPLPPDREVWLVTRRHDRRDPAIRRVVEFLAGVFAEARPLFEA